MHDLHNVHSVCTYSSMCSYYVKYGIEEVQHNKNQSSNLENCGYLLVHTGGAPVNERSALHVLVRSPPVWVYPVLQEYVIASL